MKKVIIQSFYFIIPIIILVILLSFFNVIKFDFKYAHQSSMVYKQPIDLPKYFILNKINKFKNSFKKKTTSANFRKLNLFVSEQNLKKLLSNTPYSTKEWVQAKINFKRKNQDISLRYHGDNPSNWLFEKKSFKLKTKRNELIESYRAYDFLIYTANLFSSYYLSKKMSLLTQDAEIIDLNLNGEEKGLFIKLNKIDESFLRNNKLMPVNIFKGENQATEQIIGLNGNLFNNPKLWTKVAIFNQRDRDDYSDLKKFLKILNGFNEDSSRLEDYIDVDYFSKFEAYLTLTQNNHHDWYHNLRLVSDPWSGRIFQFITDPFIPRVPKDNVLIDFASNDFSKKFNLKTKFIHKKYTTLYHYLKNKNIVDELSQYYENIKSDLIIADSKEPYSLFRDNYLDQYNKVINQLNSNKNRILEILENNFNNSFWSMKDKTIQVVVGQSTPLSDIDFYFEKDPPEWIAIDENNNSIIEENETKYYSKNNLTNKVNVPVVIYSNRLVKTLRETHISQEQKISNVETVFNFITSDNSQPSKLESKNYFTKKKHLLDFKSKHFSVNANNDNSIISFERNIPKFLNLSGEIDIKQTQVFDTPVKITKNTIFNIYPGQHIIFKNKVEAVGTKEQPIIFRKANLDNIQNTEIKPWGSLILLGEKTKNSIFNHIDVSGGSGGLFRQFSSIAMLSIHNSNNIKILNSKFSSNEIFDDTIHVVYSDNISFKNMQVNEANADAIDIDTSDKILFEDIKIIKPKNDGIDFMESTAEINNLKVYDANDKGVSIGEKSLVKIKDSTFNNNHIGVAVKDKSIVEIYNSDFNDNDTQLASYAKNWRYGGGGKLKIFNSRFFSKLNKYNVLSDPANKEEEKSSRLLQDSSINILNSTIEGKIEKNGDKIYIN